jgi:hypothetical protein
MITCPQCNQPIDGIATATYAVGWCQRDIHRACFLLHAGSCAKCRFHNEGYLSYHRDQPS